MIDHLKELKKEIDRSKAGKILIEMPEGLKYYIKEIREIFNDYEITFSGENVYGACDSCQDCIADIIIHIGHSEIPNMPLKRKTYFVEYYKNIEKFPDLEILKKYNCRKIGLFSSIQYINEMERMKKFLHDAGYEAFTGKGDQRLKYPGQILGCDFSSFDDIRSVDCNLVISDGIFHALGLSLYSGKITFAINPISGEINKIENETFIRKRYAIMEKALDCSEFGIIVSRKIGQSRFFIAEKLKKIAEMNGKRAEIILMDEINAYKLENLPYECFINTACPRVSIDDQENYKKIVLTSVEGAFILNGKIPEKYFMDTINMVDGSRSI